MFPFCQYVSIFKSCNKCIYMTTMFFQQLTQHEFLELNRGEPYDGYKVFGHYIWNQKCVYVKSNPFRIFISCTVGTCLLEFIASNTNNSILIHILRYHFSSVRMPPLKYCFKHFGISLIFAKALKGAIVKGYRNIEN